VGFAIVVVITTAVKKPAAEACATGCLIKMFHVKHFRNFFCGNSFERGNSQARQGLRDAQGLPATRLKNDFIDRTGVSRAACGKSFEASTQSLMKY
jgi:hypothetical protein